MKDDWEGSSVSDEYAFAMGRKCFDCGSLPGEVCITGRGREYKKLHIYRKSKNFDEAGQPLADDREPAEYPTLTPREQAVARMLARRELSAAQWALLETLTYTVVGVWQSDEPIPVGVIKGDHDVTGGDESHFDGGVWATSVDAPSADRAEAEAVAKMLGGQA